MVAGFTALIALLVYLPALRNEFLVWDDSAYVTRNPLIRSLDLAFLRSAFLEFRASNWHPLTWVSHALDYAIWGLNPVGHHLTNIILHAINTALVVLVTIRLIRLDRGREGTQGAASWLNERGSMIIAGVTGLLFGLHPIHVESVAWVAERKDLLCALFFLMSILAYGKFVSGTLRTTLSGVARTGRLSISYALALCFFALALMSKPMAVSLPFVLLIIDWCPAGRIHSLRSFWGVFVEKLPFLLLSLGSSVITLLAQRSGDALVTLSDVPLSSRVLVAANSVIGYLQNILLPTNLLPYYPYPSDVILFSLTYLAPVLLVFLITALCIVAARTQGFWLSIWSYYLVTLIPVLGIVQVGGQAMADRYVYLPGIGAFLLAGLAAAWVWRRVGDLKTGMSFLKATGAAFAAVLCIALGYLTVRQTGFWQNGVTLWSHAIARSSPEDIDFVYRNRAQEFFHKGQFALAIQDYSQALAWNPNSYETHLNRGMAYSETGQFDGAIADFDRAIALCPRCSEAYNNKGMLYGKVGLYDKAIGQFSKAIDIDPDRYRMYYNRGLAHFLAGQNARALNDLNRALELNGDDAQAFGARGNLFLRTGRADLALLDFQKACDLGDREGCRVLKTLTRQ